MKPMMLAVLLLASPSCCSAFTAKDLGDGCANEGYACHYYIEGFHDGYLTGRLTRSRPPTRRRWCIASQSE